MRKPRIPKNIAALFLTLPGNSRSYGWHAPATAQQLNASPKTSISCQNGSLHGKSGTTLDQKIQIAQNPTL